MIGPVSGRDGVAGISVQALWLPSGPPPFPEGNESVASNQRLGYSVTRFGTRWAEPLGCRLPF